MTIEIEQGVTKMTNTALLQKLIDWYNSVSYTHNYIFGFTYKGNIYMAHADATILPFILKLDRASRGAGYSLRFKPNMAQKLALLTNAEVICSVEYFKSVVYESKYNKGEVFEKMVTEKYGQVWEKDNVPFYKDGDITVDGIAYQIKFEAATFTNEKQMVRGI